MIVALKSLLVILKIDAKLNGNGNSAILSTYRLRLLLVILIEDITKNIQSRPRVTAGSSCSYETAELSQYTHPGRPYGIIYTE